MFETMQLQSGESDPDYKILVSQARELIRGESDLTANLANICALLNVSLPKLNWAGFYIWRSDRDQLLLGPFQGKPACLTISSGSGVCGTAHQQQISQRIANVHEFPGHIACDSQSNSELVVPILCGGDCVAVIDLDSPEFDRFRVEDQQGIEELAAVLASDLNWG